MSSTSTDTPSCISSERERERERERETEKLDHPSYFWWSTMSKRVQYCLNISQSFGFEKWIPITLYITTTNLMNLWKDIYYFDYDDKGFNLPARKEVLVDKPLTTFDPSPHDLTWVRTEVNFITVDTFWVPVHSAYTCWWSGPAPCS